MEPGTAAIAGGECAGRGRRDAAGGSAEAAIAKARTETADAVVKSWLVFTAPLFFSFRYLRPENRVPLLSCVGACWNTYLSYIANRRDAAQPV